ncbi:MAG: hypothetical protein A49_25320 [Methyloceanibacter sp.]|nr:MAG: hypothetical protein A49_25320 [Methyloceanibacter sp.]
MSRTSRSRRVSLWIGVLTCVLTAAAWLFSAFRSLHVAGETLTVSLSLGCLSFRANDDGPAPDVRVLRHAFIVEWLPAWDRGLTAPLWMAFVRAAVGTAAMLCRLILGRSIDSTTQCR